MKAIRRFSRVPSKLTKKTMKPRHDAKPGGHAHTSLIDDDWPQSGLVAHPLRRTWTWASLILIVVALGAETVGKNHDAGDDERCEIGRGN